jgi:hypothetical protein
MMPVAHSDERRLNAVDLALVIIFLAGIYLGVALPITQTVPMPAAPSGFVGVVLLWRRRDDITPSHLAALLVVLLCYIGSILSAANYSFLIKRFTGLIQLTYSLMIGYALFLTLVRASRDQLARLFMGFSLLLLIGALLESYGGLRPISDAVRSHIYDRGIYDADLRDEILYGRIRPKVFSSEPSAVTFSYTLFAFGWLATTRWRWKYLGYLGLLGVAFVALPGPTLLLMLLLAVPVELFLSGSTNNSAGRGVKIVVMSAVVLIAFAWASTSIFSQRFRDISQGNDASFFFRVTGPALTAIDVLQRHPWAGAGLTGENYIADEIMNVYMRSGEFYSGWQFQKISDSITNYFWLHWIYLGMVWGVIVAIALNFWLKVLGVRNTAFCWMVWAVLGQASGAYVSPKNWTVLLLAAAAAVARRQQPAQAPYAVQRPPRPYGAAILAGGRPVRS